MRLAWVLVSVGVLVALIGLNQQGSDQRLIYGFRSVSVYTHHSPFGPYYNRNHAASLMLLSLLAGLGLFFSRWSSWRSSRGIGALADLASQQILLGMLILTIGAGILWSGSRTALHCLTFSLAAGLLLSALRASKSVRLIILILGLAAAGGYAGVLYRNPRYLAPLNRQFIDTADNPWRERLSIYRSSWVMLKDSPWTGYGLGGFAAAFPPYQELALGNVLVVHAHSDWLELLLETGILGFGVIAGALMLLFARALPAGGPAVSGKDSVMRLWLVCAAFSFLLHGLVEFSFTTPANAVAFLAILAALGAQSPAAIGKMTALWPNRLACLLGLALILRALPPLAAAWPLYRASRVDILSRTALLAEAYRLDASPATLHKLSVAQFQRAQLTLTSRADLARDSLRSAQGAWLADPHNVDYRYTFNNLLQRLGRISEAWSYQ